MREQTLTFQQQLELVLEADDGRGDEHEHELPVDVGGVSLQNLADEAEDVGGGERDENFNDRRREVRLLRRRPLRLKKQTNKSDRK